MSDDAVQVSPGLYIGGIVAARKAKLEGYGIRHLVSVMKSPSSRPNQLVIAVDDSAEADLLTHFNEAFDFIQGANAPVLVHCVAGVCRSVTVACAYLMRKNNWTAIEALDHVRIARPEAEPNRGFMHQLHIYKACNFIVPNSKVEAYRTYAVAHGLHVDLPPRLLRCKQCRHTLAVSEQVTLHAPKDPAQRHSISAILPSCCGHYFCSTLEWMEDELSKGQVEGRLCCPRCRAKVGAYRWQGMTCTCGAWITPAIALQFAKIDESVAA